MRFLCLAPVLLCLFVAVATPSFAQATREELTLKKSTSSTTDPPEVPLPDVNHYKFSQRDFSNSRRTPVLFLSRVEITTIDFRRYKQMLVEDVIFDYNTGDILRLETDPPEVRGQLEVFSGVQILAAAFKDRSGIMYYYAQDLETGRLRPASRPLIVTDDVIKKADRERVKLAAEYGEDLVKRKPPEAYEK
ncbi:hypothetical protein [Lignipirellula cremea]|uniref:Uncharacterized protein n=1 Tax=Lignipirellula cremea TaxID=2528010 RepID=A0A518DZN2_9BACT|nr:hypothetical protein [Lignipirellula cremea]QDU97275.1 hypothetical protein Pla8534_51210 [Lignipirellula cremea]